MHPDKIHIGPLSDRYQPVLVFFIDPNLRHLRQKNVTGMYVNTNGCSCHILHDLSGQVFVHITLDISGKDPVHIQIKSRDSTRDRIDSHRIHGRIDIDDTREAIWRFLYSL